MRYKFFGLVLAMIAVVPVAQAQVYQCKDAAGRLSFSDRPCATHQTGGLVQRQRTNEEIYRERERAYNAETVKQQRYMAEQQRELMEQRRQPIQAPVVRHSGNDWAARQNLKNLETSASSITNNGGKWDQAAEAAREEERRAAQRERAQAQAAAEAQRPKPTSFTNCNGSFCYDNQGGAYNRATGDSNLMFGPNGQACRRTGNFWNCN